MNEFGLTLIWCAIQVTVLCAASGLLYLLVRRVGPATASLTALTSLFLVVTLSAFAFSPWPRWGAGRSQDESNSSESEVARAAPTAVVPDDATATTESPDRVSDGPTASSTAADFLSAFWDELQRPATSAAYNHSGWRWSAAFALFFLIGGALGSVRLIAGLVSMRAWRRKSRPVADAELLEIVERLRSELQCRRPIELRQSDSLTTPATIGWRRPLILLPAGWTEWSQRERRVVLAHEIAHIRRNDFLAWVCAQVGLALHFYHPLVHWLARRLRLQQELAADADAASVAGGRQPYLTTLAEMALRQADHPLSWPARTFLPARGTFLRRIEMLRDSKNMIRPTSGGRRLAIVVVLFLAALAAAGFRGTMSNPSNEVLAGESAAGGQFTSAPANQAAAKATLRRAKGNEPFSLAYIPRDVFVVGALRPAKLLSHPESRALAAALRQDNVFEKQIGIRLDRIEMAMFCVLRRTTLRGRADFDLACVIARTKTGDDAKRVGSVFAPNAVKESYADQEYYRSESRRFYFMPDERTVITSGDIGLLRRIIVAGKTGAAKAEWAKTWQQMARSDAAILYNLGSVRAEIQAEMERAPGPVRIQLATFAPLWQNTTAAAVGVTLDKQLTLKGVAKCGTADDAKEVRDTLAAAITLGRNALSQLRETASARSDADGPIMLRAADAADALLDKVTVSQKEETVTLTGQTSIEDTATVATALMDAVKAARAAARRAQSTNNLKQLALAFHNYHDVYKRFPPAVVMGPDGKTPHSWRIEVLPFLEQKKLYDQYRMTEPWDSPHNKKLLEKMPAVFRDPNMDPASTNSCYFALTGNGSVFSKKEGTSLRDITDGSSNTILLVDAKREIPWTKPEDIPYDPDKKIPALGGFQENVFLTAYCDGSVRSIAQTIDEKVLRALITMSDGQRIPQDF